MSEQGTVIVCTLLLGMLLGMAMAVTLTGCDIAPRSHEVGAEAGEDQ